MALPLPKAFWPLSIITGVNDRIDFQVGLGNLLTATIPPVTCAMANYYLNAESFSLLSQVQAAMRTACGRSDLWVGFDTATGKAVITVVGSSISLFPAGPNASRSLLPALGFTSTTSSSVGDPAVSQVQHANGWYSAEPVVDDTGNLPRWTRAQTRALSGRLTSLSIGGSYSERVIELAFQAQHKVFVALEGSHTNEALERMITDGWARFRWWPDATVEDVWADYALDLDTAKALQRDRLSLGTPLYSYTLKMRRFP